MICLFFSCAQQVSATDVDGTTSEPVRYALTPDSKYQNDVNAFSIDEEHGVIRTTEVLDFEQQPDYRFLVNASASGRFSTGESHDIAFCLHLKVEA